MGSDPLPFMVNSSLFAYESKWMLQTKKSKLQKATFVNTFGFIDELRAINNIQEKIQKNQTNLHARISIKEENTSNLKA